MSGESKYIYFTTIGNRQRQISKEEWEREWLRWWEKNKSKEGSEKSS
jgi:hypothetical protein